MTARQGGESVSPQLLWRVYHVPIILGCISMVCVVAAIILFIKSYQSISPITFSLDSAEVFGEATVSGRQTELIVDVEGAVVRPGIFRLPGGSRVDDAIAAAGGFTAYADADAISRSVNRAAKLTDGAKLYIPVIGEQAAGADQTSAASGLPATTNINSATQYELEALSGVGPVTAEKIIAGRPYMRIEELIEKKVIGRSLFEKLKDQLSL